MKFGAFSGRQRQAERMSRMMERLDVDAVSLAESRTGRGIAEAARLCEQCSRTGCCEAYLAGQAPEANPYAFCPNGALFDEHRRR